MNPIDKYNNIILSIEAIIQKSPSTKPATILSMILKQEGYTERELAIIIRFFTDMSLVDYIKKRKMNYIYNQYNNNPDFNTDNAILLTGYNDQSAFIKSFKKQFNITPSQIKSCHSDLSIPPLTIDILQNNHESVKKEKEHINMDDNNIFGITEEKYEKILSANGFKELYGFNKLQSNAAYDLSEKYNIPLKDTFEFVDDFCIQWYADKNGNIHLPDKDKFLSDIHIGSLTLFYSYKFDLSICEMQEILFDFDRIDVDITDVPLGIIDLYIHGEIPIKPFWDIYMFALDHADEIEYVDQDFFDTAYYHGFDSAIALNSDDNLYNYEYLDPSTYDPYYDVDLYSGENQTDFSKEERIDINYDPDNPYYDD